MTYIHGFQRNQTGAIGAGMALRPSVFAAAFVDAGQPLLGPM